MRLLIKISIISAGIVAIVAALPIGLMAEIGISGCCGAPSNGREGLGYIIGGVVGIAGLAMLIFGIRFKR